ncbi:MAG: DUF3365 domain-containing protein [Planctomycetales bacterium]|nr:DUF3365 domain-containing protein [Planctomycetales bacterium]
MQHTQPILAASPASRASVLGLAVLTAVIAAATAAVTASQVHAQQPAKAPQALPAPASVPSVEEARRQATALHTVVHAMLQTVHDTYYREDEGLRIPASVFKDVFGELEQSQRVRLRWLAIEGKAMNTEHLPRDEFEREAVRILKAQREAHEDLTNGVYRRAAPIRLSNHCLKCHVPDRRSTKDRIAGLIVQMNVGP